MCSLSRTRFSSCMQQAGAFCQKAVQLAAPVTISAVLSRNVELHCWITWSSEATDHLPRTCLQTITQIESQAGGKDKVVAKWVLFNYVREKGRDKLYPGSWGAQYHQGRPQLLPPISCGMKECCPGRRVPSFVLPPLKQSTLAVLVGGTRGEGLVCLSCLSLPHHTQVHGLGRRFVLQTVPAACTDEVELTFVTAEKAPLTEATCACVLVVLRAGTNAALVTVHLTLKSFKKVCKSCIAELALPNLSARQANMIAPFCGSLN